VFQQQLLRFNLKKTKLIKVLLKRTVDWLIFKVVVCWSQDCY